MTSAELRQKFIEFFKEKGHEVLPSASLVLENDPSVLFTTAGMHPLVPYLLGEKHPLGKRLTDVQKCLRTDDIDEVGDSQHLTFFEMLGYWSLGDYFKKESIKYTFEFYTKVLGFSKEDISVSVFAGDGDALFDEESYLTWKDEIGIPENRIYKYPKKENWWGPVSEIGPCGPCTEMFVDTGIDACSDNCGPSCKCDKFVEIGNNVFMEYFKTVDGKFEKLEQKNVDVGLGLERLAMFSQGKKSVFEIDIFELIINKIIALADDSKIESERSIRIVADHLRAATFAIAEGVKPSNAGRGYVVRRLIRRAIRYGKMIGISGNFISDVSKEVIVAMRNEYPELIQGQDTILNELDKEQEKFQKTIEEGLKKAEFIFKLKTPIDKDLYQKIMQDESKKDILKKIYRNSNIDDQFPTIGIPVTNKQILDAYISGEEAFNLFQSYGFPIEMIIELVQEKCLFVGIGDFREEMTKHQDLSRTASAGMFKGGLAETGEMTTKYHTASHLLLSALQKLIDPNIIQKGSNITVERHFFHNNW